jgi:hypothetical protein
MQELQPRDAIGVSAAYRLLRNACAGNAGGSQSVLRDLRALPIAIDYYHALLAEDMQPDGTVVSQAQERGSPSLPSSLPPCRDTKGRSITMLLCTCSDYPEGNNAVSKQLHHGEHG